ncbi:hypothetical protein ILUMI_24444 [Ignelater luminosus]|uniref:YqaJ viral recombinase domain-containing protein n=1 Tax=Ignelater luminosus TaxID=2038154 RepID=A0A8K0CAJ1_IGNLU|nr:hypothetical protein ILUMI_24444 [Ignelater luminosus]
MWLHRRSEEPEPTATVCYWKKATLSQVGTNLKFLRVTDIKKPVKTYDLLNSDIFFKNVVEELKKRQCNTQLSPHCFPLKSYKDYSLHQIMLKFIKTGQSSADDFISFAKNEMFVEGCAEIAKITRSQSESKLWYELRFYEIADCKTGNGTLVEQIIGASKSINNEAMERGRRLEKEVVQELEKKWSIRSDNCALLLHPQYPIIGASPDAVGSDFVIEILKAVKILQ